MDPQIAAALITTAGVLALPLGAFLGRSKFADRLFRKRDAVSILGKWESSWKDCEPGETLGSGNEFVIVESQRGTRVVGHIYMDAQPDKRWDFQGSFNGRFFQLMYFPSEKADNPLFLDYGCYFLELKGNGSFEGYSIGYQFDNDRTGPSKHQMRRVGGAA